VREEPGATAGTCFGTGIAAAFGQHKLNVAADNKVTWIEFLDFGLSGTGRGFAGPPVA
jgi:hypothetical protein